MKKKDDRLIVIKEQVINDKPISGLKLRFRKTNRFSILTIFGDFEYGNRDFYFDEKGKFSGTGTAVSECQSDGS